MSKHSAELYIDEFARRNNLKYTILRYRKIYGPKSDMRNSIYNIITKQSKIEKLFIEAQKNQLEDSFMLKMPHLQVLIF